MRTIRFLALPLIWQLLAPTAGHAQTATFLQRFDDWSTYRHASSRNKLCFAISQPRDTEPKNVRRDPIFFYVSTWPNEGVRNEISVKIGYPFKPRSVSTAIIGTDIFKLFTKGDKAFVENPADQTRLIEAMKKGSKMIIEGRSRRGTKTRDVYSLSGVSAAITHASTNCK